MNDTYLHMCELAYELQNHWHPRLNDRVYLKADLYYVEDFGLTTVRPMNSVVLYPEKVYYLREDLNFPEFTDFCIYMPDQSSIQNLVLDHAKDQYSTLTSFVDFVVTRRFGKLVRRHSFDELWLMFYYYKLYNKIWDGSEWVLVEENLWSGTMWS